MPDPQAMRDIIGSVANRADAERVLDALRAENGSGIETSATGAE